ncbi:MAG: VRR-NUC domain-containing protein [Alphaproteobacteria bacterium]|nr:VRR-NUC domain-containing protein [Alphaproteobacteria bacterium]
MIFAVPNGGCRNSREAAIMKAEGVTAGVADVILLVSRDGYNSLCIEFKTEKGRQSELQRQWQDEAEKNGNKYVICRSFKEFYSIINEYLNYER